jgi:uncharacterized protein YciI
VTSTTWYLYRLTPSRRDFASTMTETETAIMAEHFAYWAQHTQAGQVMVYSPVADPAGDWGLAIVRAHSAEDVARLGDLDPAVMAGAGMYDVLALPGAVTPSR